MVPPRISASGTSLVKAAQSTKCRECPLSTMDLADDWVAVGASANLDWCEIAKCTHRGSESVLITRLIGRDTPADDHLIQPD